MTRAARLPASCLAIYLLLWTALAIRPHSRETWFHENLLVFTGVPAVILLHRRHPFSNLSILLLTLFFAIHAYGAHYTYSRTPLGDWVRATVGGTRNHYDRFVHFIFGVLVAPPAREYLAASGAVSRRFAYVAAFLLLSTFSSGYELLEWSVARLVDPDAGHAFLGTQGDPWDAQKDMALAHAGSVLSLGVAYLARRRAA